MAYEYLKPYFATEEGAEPASLTYEQLVAALDADKGVSLVNLKDGGYISKEKFDAKDTELKGITEQLAVANETIKGFEGQDIEGIKAKVAEWETKYTEETEKLQSQLKAQERTHAEEMFLSGYQFTSKAARNGILAELRAKDLKIEDGALLGGKDFMDGLMADDEYKGAFVSTVSSEGFSGEPDTGASATEGAVGASGNIYTGQTPPRFSTGTNGGVGTDNNAAKFNFGFTHLKEPEGN